MKSDLEIVAAVVVCVAFVAWALDESFASKVEKPSNRVRVR